MRIYWINIYPHGRGMEVFDRREMAEYAAKGKAIYRIKIILK